MARTLRTLPRNSLAESVQSSRTLRTLAGNSIQLPVTLEAASQTGQTLRTLPRHSLHMRLLLLSLYVRSWKQASEVSGRGHASPRPPPASLQTGTSDPSEASDPSARQLLPPPLLAPLAGPSAPTPPSAPSSQADPHGATGQHPQASRPPHSAPSAASRRGRTPTTPARTWCGCIRPSTPPRRRRRGRSRSRTCRRRQTWCRPRAVLGRRGAHTSRARRPRGL